MLGSENKDISVYFLLIRDPVITSNEPNFVIENFYILFFFLFVKQFFFVKCPYSVFEVYCPAVCEGESHMTTSC